MATLAKGHNARMSQHILITGTSSGFGHLTALSLGIADKAHEAMYDAIWRTGELGIADPATRQLKKTLPSMNDIAKFYERTTGVKAQDFVNASKSFAERRRARTELTIVERPNAARTVSMSPQTSES